MSFVSSVVLSFSILEEVPDRLKEVNGWLHANRHGGFVVHDDPEEWCNEAGGEKAMQRPTFLAAFNTLDVEAFAAAVKAVKWEEPEAVQLHICSEAGDRYELILNGNAIHLTERRSP